MKKHILLFSFILLMLSSFAQTTMMQRKMLPGKIDTLLMNYFSYSKFSSLEDVGFSDAVALQFKLLFTPGAKLTDEVNPSYYDKNYDHPFDLPIRTVDEYLTKTKENYPAGLFVKYNAIQVDYPSLTLVILKETNGTTKGGLLYKVTDTLKLKLILSADFKTIKIQDISVMGYTITLANDDDRDFIPNEIDKCPKEPGFRSGTGCFTKEEKAAFLLAEKDRKQKEKDEADLAKNNPGDTAAISAKARLDKEKKDKEALAKQEKKDKKKDNPGGPQLPGFFIGLTVSGGNNTFKAPFDETNLGYKNMITGSKSVNSIGTLMQSKKAPFTQIQLDVDYYIGKKKNIGIATGIGVSSFNSSFTMDSFHVEYQATDSRGQAYRRIQNVRSMEEDLKIKSLNIPIILQYKLGLGDKTNIALGLGFNYHNVSSAKVSGTATADYEAIYKFDNNGTPEFDDGITPSRNSWLITRSNVEAHNGKTNEKDYFVQKRADGYDVAIDQALKKDEDLKLGGSLGLILRANVNFKLSEKLWFATLVQFQSISFTNGSAAKNYTLSDEIGSYNVLLKNVNTFKAGTVSVGVGLKFTIK